ncbi:hypothetical protein PVAP13_4KG119800 [Panicum virgatum]|uniref:Uncharacterized protein n=1 Tax=Panicum virgatum TaxID=38727 RepID=A0A8T0TJE7_PANVG|nr:hypothetical protein PVAP13_4KG119800 [Panicum virgatum]
MDRVSICCSSSRRRAFIQPAASSSSRSSPSQRADQGVSIGGGGRRGGVLDPHVPRLHATPAPRAAAGAGCPGGDLRRGPPRRGQPQHPVRRPEISEAGRRGVHQWQRQHRNPRRRRSHLAQERIKENTEIFDWELSDEDRLEISQLPQHKVARVTGILCPKGVSGVHIAEVDVLETKPASPSVCNGLHS